MDLLIAPQTATRIEQFVLRSEATVGGRIDNRYRRKPTPLTELDAELTINSGNGFYSFTSQIWNPDNQEFEVAPDPQSFSAFELSGKDDIEVPTFVIVQIIGDDDGGFQWVFSRPD